MEINLGNNRHLRVRVCVGGAGTPGRVRARNANSTKLSNANGGRGGWLLYIVPSTHFTAIFQNRVRGGGGALGN